MGRYLILTLVATFCAAVPTTDLVIPAKVDFDTYPTSTSFIQAMSKSGGTETDCRTFATTTINTIKASVKSEQGILNAEDTGKDCADEGQGDVANAQGKLAAANKDQLAKQATAGTTLDTKKTACTASVAFIVNLDTLESSECYDTAKEQSYINAKSTCTSATSAMTTADEAVTTAKTTVKDGQREHDDALAQAAQLKSACHCRVQRDQAAAWTAASNATAAHAADWKQAHEVACALNSATSCDIPTCPTVTQPTLAAGVSDAVCTEAPIKAPIETPSKECECTDRADWMSYNEYDCSDYVNGEFCVDHGEEADEDEVLPASACCMCGGGTCTEAPIKAPIETPSKECECTDPDAAEWSTRDGYTCAHFSPQSSTLDQAHFSALNPGFSCAKASLAVNARIFWSDLNGVSPGDACCICGGGTRTCT